MLSPNRTSRDLEIQYHQRAHTRLNSFSRSRESSMFSVQCEVHVKCHKKIIMNQAERICRLNNEGVILLSNGQTDGALSKFLDAAHCMAGFLDTMENSEFRCPSTILPVIEQAPFGIKGFAQLTEYFVFDRVFLLRPAEGVQVAVLYSAAILFNLGQASHVEARCGRDSAYDRAKAMHFLSLQVLRNSRGCGSLVVPLTLLNSNNMIQIHHELADYNSAKRCRYELTNALVSSQTRVRMLPKAVFERILVNLLKGLHPDSSAGAA